MDGRSSQSGYFYGHSSYDQSVAGIRPNTVHLITTLGAIR